MGVFKKLFKGIKKVFKKIARGIKKAFKAFGKFMGKIGFVGQMAMMFLFPGGIGNLLTKGLGKLGAKLAAVGGANPTGLAKAVQGVGNVLTKTQQFVTKARAGFGSITDGIKEFGKNKENIENIQKAFNHRAKMNGLSSRGKWSENLEKEFAA